MIKENKQEEMRNLIAIILLPLYSLFSIIATWSNFQYSFPDVINIFRLIEIVLAILLVLNYLLSHPTYKEAAIYALILLLATYSSWKLGDHRFLFFVLFLFGSINTNYFRIIRVDFVTKILIFATVILSYKLGFIENISFQRVGSNIIRHGLGFSHPNFLGMIVMLICLEYILLRKSKISIIEVVMGVLFVIFFNSFSDSRSAEIISVIAFIIAFILKEEGYDRVHKFFKKKVVRKSVEFFPILFAIISFLVVNNVKSGSTLYSLITANDSGRLDIFQFYYSLAGLHLFPKKINSFFMNSTFVGMDNAYIYLLVSFGLIVLFVYILSLSILIRSAIDLGDYYLLMIIIIFLLFGLVESIVIYPFVGFYAVTLQRKKSNNMTNNLKIGE